MNQNYKLTLYAVQVYGVRLSDYHEPRPVEILCNSEEEQNTIREGQKMVTFMTNLIATISVKKRRAAR